MANINLYQSIQQEQSVSQKKGLMDKGFLLVILLLVVSSAIWGGLKAYNIYLNKKISNLDNEIAQETGRIEAAKINRVADFQERLDTIKTSIAAKENPSEFLSNLEKATIQGVTLDSCEFNYANKDKKDVMTLTAFTDSYTLLAEQVLSLKNSGYFKEVELGQISRGQDGKIKFIIEAKFDSPKNQS